MFQEDGPTIYELAHDDMLHSEASQDAIHPVNYITVDVNAASPNVPMRHSPSEGPGSSQYHVTMEDGDELETGTVTTNLALVDKNVDAQHFHIIGKKKKLCFSVLCFRDIG